MNHDVSLPGRVRQPSTPPQQPADERDRDEHEHDDHEYLDHAASRDDIAPSFGQLHSLPIASCCTIMRAQ